METAAAAGNDVTIIRDVELLRDTLPEGIGVKASGGIDTPEAAEAVIAAPGVSLQMGRDSVGVLTSFSPLGDLPVGLGYVRASCAEDGATVSVLTAQGRANATLVALPGRWTRPYGFEGEVEG